MTLWAFEINMRGLQMNFGGLEPHIGVVLMLLKYNFGTLIGHHWDTVGGTFGGHINGVATGGPSSPGGAASPWIGPWCQYLHIEVVII